MTFHYDHTNILKYDNRPDKSIEEMNQRITNNVNQYVKEKDILIYCGDFCLTGTPLEKYIERVKYHLGNINCKSIIFIAGNHDRLWTYPNGERLKNQLFWQLFSDIHTMGWEFQLNKQTCELHEIPKRFSRQLITFTHYALRVWNGSDKVRKDGTGLSVCCFGHSHGQLPPLRNSIDVGFNIWNRPLSIVEILEDIIPKYNTTLPEYCSHHGK